MSLRENLLAMRQTASELLDDFLLLFDEHLRREGDRAWVPYGSLPPQGKLAVAADEPPSSRLTCDVALGYLVAAVEQQDKSKSGRLSSRPYGKTAEARLQTALALLRHAFTRQHPRGWFVWNYGQYEIDQVDLGTVLDTYYWFWTLLGERLPGDVRDGIADSTGRAIGYLKTAEQPEHPGIIQKRAADPDRPESRRTANYQTIDVINGNALAITAFCRAATILGDPSLVDEAARYQRNVVESFGRHVPDWWVYIERLATREVLGPETILYQAMTALYLEPLYRARPSAELRDLLARSLRTLDAVCDAGGGLDWSHESREMFIDTQLLMLPSAAAALADVCDITDAGRRRLDLVSRTMYDRQAHWFVNAAGRRGHGEPAGELMQIWAASDLALIILSARRFLDGLSTR